MEYVASARIAQLQVIDLEEIRRVQLALPDYVEIGGRRYPPKRRIKNGELHSEISRGFKHPTA